MVRFLLCFAMVLPASSAITRRADVTSTANPVRKVVTLLQKMQKKVESEGEHAEGLFKKFMCYCESSGKDLGVAISAAETKIPSLAASIKASSSRKLQLEDDLKSHQRDRAAANKAIADATAMRQKGKTVFDKELADSQANLAALKKAAAAISAGMGSFLQTEGARILQKIVSARQDMSDGDREEVLSFLAGRDQGDNAPSSGEILGILKTMADDMQTSQADLIGTEDSAVSGFEALVAAKKKEIATLANSIESKMARVGEVGVEIATMKNDAGDTADALLADKAFANNLQTSCSEKTKTHETDTQIRASEVSALADTIKILNDDDALELFKKTLPSASVFLMQVQKSKDHLRSQAQAVLKTKNSRLDSRYRPRLDFILLALRGKKTGFAKIITLIDALVASLKTEQHDDDAKKEFCAAQFDQVEDKIKGLGNSISDSKIAIAESQESKSSLAEEIAALKVGMAALDSALADATANRKAESAEYRNLMTSNAAARDLILYAKNRLNQFYNPTLYKAPPKRQLSDGDQIFENQGGDIPTAAAGGIANTGIAALIQLRFDGAPPPPPSTAAAYTAKSQDSNGVIAMMNLLVQDLDKETAEAEVDERNGQAEYEKTVADSAEKRRSDSKSLLDKEAAQADLSALLGKLSDGQMALNREQMGASRYLASLHGECDWLVEYFSIRKQARTDEIESLGNAKAVLSGADFSLLESESIDRPQTILSA